MNPIKKNIPNSITCINLLSGCMAIIAATGGVASLWGLPSYQWAFIFIGIGAVADFLDGLAARTLHAYSDLGKELDSLCDLVTFGVAPAMIMFFLLREISGCSWLPYVSLVIPVAGALRLARFNIDTRQTTSFIGLPIPANSIFWIGYAAMIAQTGVTNLALPYVFAPVAVLESWLMLSPLKIFSLKFKNLSFKENWPRFLLIIFAIAAVAFFGVPGLLILILFYLALSMAVKC